MDEDIRRILVTLIGGHADCLRSTPSLRAARKAFPSAEIVVLTGAGTSEIFERSPHVDRVITIASRDGASPGFLAEALQALRTAGRVLHRFDLVVGFAHGGRLSATLALASGARLRVGFEARIPHAWTHNLGPVPWAMSLEERNAMLWEAVGVAVTPAPAEFPLLPEDEATAKNLLARFGINAGPLIGIHPGSDWSCQQWSPEQWAGLAQAIATRFDAQIVITGTASERAIAHDIIVRSRGRVQSIAGETSLPQLGAVIRHMDAVVTVDSAVPALALAVGVPVIVISAWNFSSWSRARVPGLTLLEPDLPGPLPNARCRASKQSKHVFGCHPAECVGTQGMAATDIQRVMAAVERVVTARRASA